MHQQQQNIIHAISYDNARGTKIERPAPLSLHLKLHWNYNQQLLQGRGRENKGRQKKINKIYIYKYIYCVTQKMPVPAFFFFWMCALVWSLKPGFVSYGIWTFTKPLSFPGVTHRAACQVPPTGSTHVLPAPFPDDHVKTRKAKNGSCRDPSMDREGSVGTRVGLGSGSLTFRPGPCSTYCLSALPSLALRPS